jgi:hypothetical protein
MRALAFVLLCVGAGESTAGVSYYGWLPAIETLPDDGTAIESTITDRNDLGDRKLRETAVGAAPVFAASDRFELAVPVEAARTSELGETPTFTLRSFGIEGRYAVVPHMALLRVGLERDTVIRNLGRIRIAPVLGVSRGDLHAAVEAGLVFEANAGGTHLELRTGAGASYRVLPVLRIGAEAHAELSRDSAAVSWVAAGPNLAWIRGRSWLVGALGVGVYNIQTAARVLWGIAF